MSDLPPIIIDFGKKRGRVPRDKNGFRIEDPAAIAAFEAAEAAKAAAKAAKKNGKEICCEMFRLEGKHHADCPCPVFIANGGVESGALAWHESPEGTEEEAKELAEINAEVKAVRNERKASDNYPTPQPLADAICTGLAKIMTPRIIIEPSAGDGAFVKAAAKAWPTAGVVAVELREECRGPLEALKVGPDAPARLLIEIKDWPTYCAEQARLAAAGAPASAPALADLMLGNLPFNQAEEHIMAVWPHMKPGAILAFLLRMSFRATKRWEAGRIWRTVQLREIRPIVPRPSFAFEGGTDMSEYDLFIFQKGWTLPATTGEAIFWEK